MYSQIEVILEYYGSVSTCCKRECECIIIDIKCKSIEKQIHEFIKKQYPSLSIYSLLLDGYIWDGGKQTLCNGSRIKVFPWCG